MKAAQFRPFWKTALRLLPLLLLLAVAWRVHAQEVWNAGTGGENSRQLLKRIGREMTAHSPTLVVLQVGTNDMLNSRNGVNLEEYERNLVALVDAAQEHSAAVILVAPPPCIEEEVLKRHSAEFFELKRPNAKVREAGAVMQAVAEQLKVPLISLYTLFGEEAGHESTTSPIRNAANGGPGDGVHPTPEGYLKIATALHELIVREGLNASRVLCLGDSITYGAGAEGAGGVVGKTYPGQLLKLLRKTATEGP